MRAPISFAWLVALHKHQFEFLGSLVRDRVVDHRQEIPRGTLETIVRPHLVVPALVKSHLEVTYEIIGRWPKEAPYLMIGHFSPLPDPKALLFHTLEGILEPAAHLFAIFCQVAGRVAKQDEPLACLGELHEAAEELEVIKRRVALFCIMLDEDVVAEAQEAVDRDEHETLGLAIEDCLGTKYAASITPSFNELAKGAEQFPPPAGWLDEEH